MINDLPWRKFPRQAIRNETIDYISDLLSEEKAELRCTPLLFYTVAFCKADDDGVFDVKDGVIFSRLMKIGTSEDVLMIASLMAENGLITRIAGNIYLLNDWEYCENNRKRNEYASTLDERKKMVEKRVKTAPVSYPQAMHQKSVKNPEVIHTEKPTQKRAENCPQNTTESVESYTQGGDFVASNFEEIAAIFDKKGENCKNGGKIDEKSGQLEKIDE